MREQVGRYESKAAMSNYVTYERYDPAHGWQLPQNIDGYMLVEQVVVHRSERDAAIVNMERNLRY